MKRSEIEIGINLYSVRDYCKTAEDLDKTLGRLATIGYKAVQVSGIGPIDTTTVKQLLDTHNLICCATHERIDVLSGPIAPVVEKLTTLECDFTALGYPGNDFFNAEGVHKLCDILSRAGTGLKSAGIKLGYHNHAAEFERFTDKTFLEEIYDRVPVDVLYGEPDLHWIVRGGGCPVAWINKLTVRLPAVHMKDFAILDGQPVFAEVGEGNMDWDAIVPACREAGVRWFIVEQDEPFGDRDIFDSVKMSYNNMRGMGLGQ